MFWPFQLKCVEMSFAFDDESDLKGGNRTYCT